MPTYEFRCDKCGAVRDVILKMAEYQEKKDDFPCECGEKMAPWVGKPRFVMKGVGWHANEGTGYGITEMETRKNLEEEKRLEDQAKELREQDMRRKEF